jgi:chromosome segregation ATPase
MATTTERLGIVETKVENLSEKLDGLKDDVKELHDCLDKTRDSLTDKLNTMYDASCNQHKALAEELGALKTQRDKWLWTAAGAIAVMGWVSGHTETIMKILG